MEALCRRLPPEHPEIENINLRARNLRAGYNGERSLKFELSFLPKNDFHIIHELKLKDPQGMFQIDTLILSPNFFLIIEVKNIYGTIVFDNLNQVIRYTEDTEEGFPNPIAQVKLQKLRLKNFLQNLNIPPIPIETTVVYANPRTIIKNQSTSKIVNETVMHKSNILSKITELKQINSTIHLTANQLRKISQTLIKNHQTKQQNALHEYGIKTEQLLKGVICPKCTTIPMKRIYGTWQCDYCDNLDGTAHIPALQDYYLLINKTIANRHARHFLKLKSKDVTKQLLQKLNLPITGTQRTRKYMLHKIMDEKYYKSQNNKETNLTKADSN